MSFPKPTALLRVLCEQATSGDDIVVDFFAGSCTTGQALLETNRSDGGNRRIILVQLPEPTNHHEFRTIADIGKERLRRVIGKLLQERRGELDLKAGTKNEDLGFSVFKLSSSAFKPWPGTGACTPADFAREMELFTDPLIEKWKPENVIYEVALREGFSLTARIEKVTGIKSNKVWRVTDAEKEQTFRICLDDELKPETVRALELGKDDLLICRDCALTDKLAANLALQCRLKTM